MGDFIDRFLVIITAWLAVIFFGIILSAIIFSGFLLIGGLL